MKKPALCLSEEKSILGEVGSWCTCRQVFGEAGFLQRVVLGLCARQNRAWSLAHSGGDTGDNSAAPSAQAQPPPLPPTATGGGWTSPGQPSTHDKGFTKPLEV